MDSHAHLQSDRFAVDVDLVIGAARLAGVERILVPGWDLASSRGALDLLDRHRWLDASVGIHPHDAARAGPDDWAAIVELAADPRVVAIGETGLDYDRVFSPIADQLMNLRRNLLLGLDVGKPAIVHVRSAAGRQDAQDAVLLALDDVGVGGAAATRAFGWRPPALIHSFSGTLDYAAALLDLGVAISISGLAFRSGEEATGDVVRLVPQDRLLVETDSPFLSPPGGPRRRNEPASVRITAGWIAERRGETAAAFGEGLVGAYDRLFGGRRRD